MRKLSDFFKTLLSLSFFILISNNTFAQQDTLVKRSYTDSVHTATTVVVKNNAANDFDILNNQFENASFGDVIFIKTEDLQPSKPKSERTSFEDVMKETSKPTPKMASQPITQTQPISKSQSSSGFNGEQTAKIEKKTSTTPIANRRILYYNRGGFIKPKMKKKKLKKRKRIKRNRRNKCYSF